MRPFGSQIMAGAARHPEFVVTAPQAAQMMGVSDHVLEDMRRRGASPGFLLLGRGANPTVLYREATVLDWRNGTRTGSPIVNDADTEHRDANVGRPPQPRPAPREVLGDVYISAVEVCRKIGGIGKSTLYLWIKKGIFPPGTRVGPRRTAWSTATVDQWLQKQAGGATAPA
jgi:predicted DNA-binding transcriptional regulator AlpA